ncbi:sodium:proton antiporter [candidate division KSB1 bacterium]|nr:sodium:proton antiporter [candidate division KSB1 bacterium]
MKYFIAALFVLIAITLIYGIFFSDSHDSLAHHVSHLGTTLPLWSALPFAGILLSIAFFPILAPRFWHHHYGKVSAFWSLIFAIPFAVKYGNEACCEILEIYLLDYIPFIILLWALFTISGGILVEGTLKGTAKLNTLFILIGTMIASWIGTTGASMLLIRPLLRANAKRRYKVHIVVFFIFLVSNIGGALTPLGDPPLFLGFLHHVPFFWTLQLIVPMGFISIILLGLFYVIDRYLCIKERKESPLPEIDNSVENPCEEIETEPIRIRGLINILFLLGVIGGVLMSGLVHCGALVINGIHVPYQNLARDLILILMGMLSLQFTPKIIREANEFTWFPIKEVAYLFAGIFMTIIPALAMLKAGIHGNLAFIVRAVERPLDYFWITGILSSFLDNAPTYLTFLNTQLGNSFAGLPEAVAVNLLIEQKEIYLVAISIGAVFMGANTYIGNAPNFMVKAIAEENGIKMPGFFGYMLYSALILIPLFILLSIIFF